MASPSATHKVKRPRAMLMMNLVVRVAKRLGFAKQMAGLMLGQMMKEKIKARAFAGYTPDAHDVIVATFAKSGTNWMMQIAQQIAHHGASDFDHIHEVVPWPDGPGGAIGDIHDRRQVEPSPTGLRVIKTHLEPEFVPYSEEAVYLSVIRDPKEVLVSSYYFLGGILGVLSHLDIDDWYDLNMRENGLMDAWGVHTAGYWAWRERPNVLVIQYDEIIEQPEASLELVAKTMDVELTPEQFAAVVERSSFAWMSKNNARFSPPPSPFTKKGDEVKMIRRGKAGDSGEALSGEQQAEVDRRCLAALEKLGSDFPYAEAFMSRR